MPACQSLKDKRQIVKSLIAQAQNHFQVAVAEVECQDQWQVGVLGVSCVSTSASHADEVIARAVNYIATRKVDAQVLEYQTEVVHAL